MVSPSNNPSPVVSLPPQPLLTPYRARGPGLRRAARLVRLVLESAAALVVAMLAAAPWLSGLAWPVDLIANFTAQALFITLALAAWLLLFRRWKLLAVVAAAGLSQVAALAAPRAAWIADGPGDGPPPIRVLQYNVEPFNPRPQDAARLIEQSRADLICLLEPPLDLNAEIYQQQRFRSTHPYMIRRAPKDFTNWQYVLSRWPVREYPVGIDEFGEPPFIALVVEHPRGPVGLVLIHPASPRRQRRWEVGNQLIRDAAVAVNRMRAEGLEVVLAADLNGSPTGYRGRLLARLTGLRRCKPLWRAEGTFPSGLAWPASIALDDVWISAGLRVAGWDVLEGAGSDHRAVLVEIAAPGK